MSAVLREAPKEPCARAPSVAYRRRDPEATVLHEAVRTHLETLVAGENVPTHARKALRGFVDCGVLAKGFIRVRCGACGEESLVAFSCKDRGFCPSCTSRRAAETAAHLVDEVLSHVAHRQYVLALPPELHARVARDAELESRILRVFAEELGGYQRAVTRAGAAAKTGSVTFLQHFGSTLNLHVHFHTLALDGVYTAGDDGKPCFVRAPPPTPEQLRWLAERVAGRVRALLVRGPAPEDFEERQLPAFKLFGAPEREPAQPRLHARVDGFDLHASAPLEADDRVALERLCRYALRGPIAAGRLLAGPRGKLVYRLKTPKPDGTTELVLSALALLQRLVRLIPLPGRHMVRYHGILASAAEWRSLVVPAKPPGTLLPKPRSRRIAWADLLRRVFALELLVCACGGQRRVIATIEEGPVARKVLRHLGLPDTPPRLEPARLDQRELWPTGPPAEFAPAPPLDMFHQGPHLDPYA